MGIRKISLALLLAASSLAAVPAHAAPVILTTNIYTQNFDTLAVTGTSDVLPTGFLILETGTSSRANGSYTANQGLSNVGDVYSYGAIGGADRALGTLRSTTLDPLIGAQFTNGLGKTITSIAINYTGEMWRLGGINRLDSLVFEYSTNATSLANGTYIGVESLNFVSPNNIGSPLNRDGNSAAFRTALSGTIAGLQIKQGESLFIRFRDVDATSGDDGLAVDDFSLVATTVSAAVPEPTTWAMMIIGFGMIGGAMRRRKAAPALA